MELYNLMEKEVVLMIDNVMKDMEGVCNCKKCKLDIAAIALNNLPPKYVVSDKGYAYGKANNLTVQFTADIIAAVTNGIGVVGKNPRHD